MALNTWWDEDSDQRYWMEVATTGSIGEILIAPKFPGASWSYDLVGQVRPGDRVLHWESGGARRGLVGWSVVTDEPTVVPEYTWQPRGTAGRSLSGPRTTEGWMATLGGLNRFEEPLFTDELQRRRQAVLQVASELEAEESQQAGSRVRRGRVTRVQDPELRAAIENYAVDRAIEHYELVGGTSFLKLGKPYDIGLTLHERERHVEVKGSSLTVETVELTINEVRHAENYQPTDLVVVEGIHYERAAGVISTSGGRLRIWRDWRPLDADLDARRFACTLTDDS